MKKEKPKEEPSSLFQRQRVDLLLSELLRKFPIPQVMPADEEKSSNTNNKNDGQNEGTSQESTDSSENVNPQLQKIKQEPQEKRMKM